MAVFSGFAHKSKRELLWCAWNRGHLDKVFDNFIIDMTPPSIGGGVRARGTTEQDY